MSRNGSNARRMGRTTVPLANRSLCLPSGETAAVVREGPEGDRETQRLTRSDAVLPVVPRLTPQEISRAWHRLEFRPAKTGVCALAKAQGRRCAERDSNDFLEHVAVAVPADA